MRISQSHDDRFADFMFLEVVNSSTTVAIARGDVCVWDLAASASFQGFDRRGVYIVALPGSEASSQRVAGIAEKAFLIPVSGTADLTFVGLVQCRGLHDAVAFTGTAAQRKMVASATTKVATVVTATPTVTELAGLIGTCYTSGGTPTTVPAQIMC